MTLHCRYFRGVTSWCLRPTRWGELCLKHLGYTGERQRALLERLPDEFSSTVKSPPPIRVDAVRGRTGP
jgi:hypothetical protein